MKSRKLKVSLLERLGVGVAVGVLVEFAFWIILGLLTLAFTGGVWGAAISGILGACLVFIWWDIRPSSDSPQSRESNDQHGC